MNNIAIYTTGFAGIIIGITLAILISTVILIKKTRQDYEKLGYEKIVLSDQAKEILNDSIYDYKKNYRKKHDTNFLVTLSKRVTYDVAKIYYPESNSPYAEISIDELLSLNGYIIKRVDMILSNNVIKIVKKTRVSTIIKGVGLKKKLDNSKLIKFFRSLNKKMKYVLYIINHLNPIYWARIVISKFGVKISVDMINKEILKIVAEESFKVYSKSLFTKYEDEEE